MKYINTYNLKNQAENDEMQSKIERVKELNDENWDAMREGTLTDFNDVRQYMYHMEPTDTPKVVKLYVARCFSREKTVRAKIINTSLRNSRVDPLDELGL